MVDFADIMIGIIKAEEDSWELEPIQSLVIEKQQTSAITLKGGSGSGNFGHAGRPGEVGGSATGVAPKSVTSRSDWTGMQQDAADRIQEWIKSGDSVDSIVKNGYFWRESARNSNSSWDWAVWEETRKLADSVGYKYKDSLSDQEILDDPVFESRLLSDKYKTALSKADTAYTDYRNYNDKNKLYKFVNSDEGKLANEAELHELWGSVIEQGNVLVKPSNLMAVHALRNKIALYPGMQGLRNARTFQEALNTEVTLYRGEADYYGKASKISGKLTSYTTSPQIARLFAEGFYSSINMPNTGTIVRRKVRFGDILAYINNDGEFEAILPSASANSVNKEIVVMGLDLPEDQIIEEKQTSAITLKGGSGSGNFGHAGRPGEVGGSQSGVDYHFTGISSHAQSRLTYDRNGQLNKIGDIIDELPLTHTMIDYIGDIDIDVRPDLGTYVGGSFGKTIQFSSRLIDGKYPDSLSLQYLYAPTTLHGVVSHELGHHMQRRMPMEDRISWDNLVEDRELFESFSHNRLPDVNPEFPTSMRSVELFAETFSKYLWNPQSLPIRILDYMDSTLGDKIVEEKQLPISEASKQNLIKIRTNMFADEVNALAERMFTGDITLGSWEEAMKKMIRELHTSTAAIGKGGWDQMTPADWGRLGPVLKGQYKYLHGFAQYVEENKDTVSLKAIQARARMYGNAGAFSSIVVQAGDVISKKLPWLPKDGSTECLVNCKCFWKLNIVGTEVMKGGEGSGNFGHAGREGEVGGSAPTGGSISYAEKAKDYQISNTSQMERDPFAGIQRGFITEEGILLDTKKYSHEKFADEILNVDANAVSDQNREWLDKLGLEQIDNPEVTAIMDGLTRIHILRDEIAITTKLMDTPTLHRIQKYFTSGIIKRPLDSSVSWSGYLFNYPVDVNPATVSTGIHMTWREFIAMDKVGYDARDNQIILRESVEEYIEKQLPTGDWVDVQCVWHLRPAEHCKTCVGRNNHVELIRVHRTVPIPSVIG